MNQPISHASSPISCCRSKRIGAEQAGGPSHKGSFDARLKTACADFEGIFLNFMFQSMQKTLPGDGLFGGSHQKKLYDAMFLQEVSHQLARQRSIGIGDAVHRQLLEKIYGHGEREHAPR